MFNKSYQNTNHDLITVMKHNGHFYKMHRNIVRPNGLNILQLSVTHEDSTEQCDFGIIAGLEFLPPSGR